MFTRSNSYKFAKKLSTKDYDEMKAKGFKTFEKKFPFAYKLENGVLTRFIGSWRGTLRSCHYTTVDLT